MSKISHEKLSIQPSSSVLAQHRRAVPRRLPRLAAGVLIAATALTACGSDATPAAAGTDSAPVATVAAASADLSSTTASFATAANAICAASDQGTTAIFSAFSAPGAAPTEAEQQAAIDSFVALARTTVEQLRAVTPPAADKVKYDQMVAAFSDGADQVEQEGLGFFSDTATDPFAAASQLATELNLTDCVTS
jgi:hypothetical protein